MKNGLVLLFVGGLFLSAGGQDYILETPTGKVSVFIKQLERGKPFFELTMINTTNEHVGFNFLTDGKSAFSIDMASGRKIKSSAPIICFTEGYSHHLPSKNYRKWKADISQYYYQSLKNLETSEYTISWKVKTSVGTLVTQPTAFFFENNTK